MSTNLWNFTAENSSELINALNTEYTGFLVKRAALGCGDNGDFGDSGDSADFADSGGPSQFRLRPGGVQGQDQSPKAHFLVKWDVPRFRVFGLRCIRTLVVQSLDDVPDSMPHLVSHGGRPLG